MEVFFHDGKSEPGDVWRDEYGDVWAEAGWYWWPCFPGCLPDGEPTGPFLTACAALADAHDG